MTCKILCLIKGQSGFVSLAEIQYPQWFPLIWAVHHPASASNVCESNTARYSIVEYSASSHVLPETILLLHVEVFQSTFFLERKYIEYWILIWNLLLLIQGRSGLVYLVGYPLSTMSVIDVSSETTCTCLCGMKARDGVFCLFKKVYHVLLRLPVGHLFKRGF